MRRMKGGGGRHARVVLGVLTAALLSCEEPEEFPLPWCFYATDVMSDRKHCGECDHECIEEEMCLEGACVADRQLALWPLPPYPLPDDQYAIHDETVVDRTTKLEWQRHLEDRRISDFEAVDYCGELELDGGSWRLPTRIELMTIVDFTRVLPAIDTEAFPDTPSSGFKHQDLSRTPKREHLVSDGGVVLEPDVRIVRGGSQVDFSEGSRWYFPEPGAVARDYELDDYVRCVRGGTEPAPIGQHYEITDEIVLDLYTGLRWQRNLPQCDNSQACPPGNALWYIEDAFAYCEALELEGYDDFRLATILELLTIAFRPWSRSVDPELFPEEADDLEVELWSSTRYALGPEEGRPLVWVLDYSDNINNAVGAVRARCVRDER